MDCSNKRVSLIIPIYNGTEYIERLHKQIMNQTYSNIEIVLVDDGSKDDSYNKLTEVFSEVKDMMSVNVIYQENAGQGAARNAGLKAATGEYIVFVDQDDYIEPDYIEQLVNANSKDEFDIVLSGYKRVDENQKVLLYVSLKDYEWCKFMNITPWGKLYKRSFIENNNIEFLPVPLGEDIYFNINCYLHTDNIKCIEYVGYSWLDNQSSVSNTMYQQVNEKVNLKLLYERMDQIDTEYNWRLNQYYQYFFLKTVLFHVLTATKATEYSKLVAYKDEMFNWMNNKMLMVEKNKLVGLFNPKGERASIRFVVCVYMILRKMNLENRFLRMLCKKV
ncbi:glycosyltransferase family 2 protein [Pseudobutyrivibrio sp. LB2011]|uniref:glycosyltransferase family 2 protein n=1 Tax=Pseudobutyrivibrio sp. LB2011 TaxID=1408312 RepID=UPI0009DF317C|nr:glycosyltransferase family A protein [Pseudobutyrivibrio sp. LB2011]